MNIYTAAFLFLWCSEATSSVGAVNNIRGGAAAAAAATATVDEQHQFDAARVLGPPPVTVIVITGCGESFTDEKVVLSDDLDEIKNYVLYG